MIWESPILPLLEEFIRRLKSWSKENIQHVPKGSNLIADSVAKIVHTRSLGLRLFVDAFVRI
ncbi:hypothetical protein Gogos_000027 [Gossypium gossypioides]|uniref:RNase H type-1 domain-containing protein n=1 Tax=Gossypium gossypioides TaxID=34282 RepID=A0A7J9CXJ5_GOSGO|nr:hypothetical protein [Gossypium gossypioides]